VTSQRHNTTLWDRVPDGVSDTFLVNSGLTPKCIMEGILSDYELKISKSVAI